MKSTENLKIKTSIHKLFSGTGYPLTMHIATLTNCTSHDDYYHMIISYYYYKFDDADHGVINSAHKMCSLILYTRVECA